MKNIKKYLLPIFVLLVATSSSNVFSKEYSVRNGDSFGLMDCPQDWGLYQGISVGSTLLRIKEDSDYSVEKTGFCVDVIHGYRCEDFPIAFEQKISFNCHSMGKISQENQFVSETDHTFRSFGVTENVIFDFSRFMESGPYIGIGGGYKELSGKQKLVYFDRSTKRKIKSIGMQGILGFNFRIYPVLDAQLEYKCFRAKRYAFIEHSLCINFRAFI